MPITAIITVDADGRLTPDSIIIINGQAFPIPERVDHGGIVAAARIGRVLKDTGWRPRWRSIRDALGPARNGRQEITLVHFCSNCEGAQPDTCPYNPTRPPATGTGMGSPTKPAAGS